MRAHGGSVMFLVVSLIAVAAAPLNVEARSNKPAAPAPKPKKPRAREGAPAVREAQLEKATSPILIATVNTKVHGAVELLCAGKPPRCVVRRRNDGIEVPASITIADQKAHREVYVVDAPFLDHGEIELKRGEVFFTR